MKLFNEIFRNKRILVTGDTGFKGSWLTIWLKELGANVYGYSLPAKTNRDNFVVCELAKQIHHVDGDIRDYEKLSNFFCEIKPEIVFHLAAQPLVLDSYNNPKYTFETNIIGTVNVFEAIRNCDSVIAALNITSDKCYQNNEWVWGYRENDPMGGKDPYSASKGCSELITSSYINSFFNKEGTANMASVRAGNVIGGGDWADFRIVPDFFRAIEINEALYLRYPNATRPWQHVLEPLGGYLLLTTKLMHGKQYCGGWNFGPSDSNNYSVLDLIKEMIKISGIGEYKFDDFSEKKHEAGLLKLDISKAKTLLNWEPVLNFSETVKLTVDGYNENICYNDRVSQIQQYLTLAKSKNINWFNY